MVRFTKFSTALFVSVLFLFASYGTALAQSTTSTSTIPLPPVVGGGHVTLDKDLQLGIEKYLSLDGVSFYSTPLLGDAFRIPKNVATVVHAKAIVKNIGEVTAVNIRLKHDFDPALSHMVFQSFAMAGGSVTYNPATGIMKIDEIPVGGQVVFFYDMTIDEQGSSEETAADILSLESYESRLPIYHNVVGGPIVADVDHLVAGNPADGATSGAAAGASGVGGASGADDSSASGHGGGTAGGDSDVAFILPQTGMGLNYWLFLLWFALSFSFVSFKLIRRY